MISIHPVVDLIKLWNSKVDEIFGKLMFLHGSVASPEASNISRTIVEI